MRHTASPYAKSAVYNTQVKTFTIARQILPHDCTLLRLLRPYRTEACRIARRETARAVRAIRRSAGTFPPPPAFGLASCMPAHFQGA
jgi:hypothetical protein